MKDRGAEMKAFEGLMGEISAALADIVGLLEKPKSEAKEKNEYGPIVAALKSLTLNAPEQKAPVINVTVPDKPTRKLKLKVEVERHANGMAKSYAISEV
jgi:hypothetical protein